VRRAKAALSSWCKPARPTAPAESNRTAAATEVLATVPTADQPSLRRLRATTTYRFSAPFSVPLLLTKASRMPTDMEFHERRNEKIRVIVPFAHVECQGDARHRASVAQEPRTQPVIKKGVGGPLIDQQLGNSLSIFNETNGIIRSPSPLVCAQIPLESGPGPSRCGWLTYRSKRRDGSEATRVFQRQRNRAMAPIEWPKMPCRDISTGKFRATMPGSSSTM